MERILICENTSQINRFIERILPFRSKVQQVVDALIRLGVEPDIREIDVCAAAISQSGFTKEQAYSYIESLIRTKIGSKVEKPQINGLPIKREIFEQAIELSEKDLMACTDALLNLSYLRHSDVNITLLSIENSEVILSEATQEQIREMPLHRIYITTQKQLDAYNIVKDIVNNLEKLKDIGVTQTIYDLIFMDSGKAFINCKTIRDIQ